MVRRVAEQREKTKTQTHMVLLDWEKAFDKINREALYIAMGKMNIPPKYIAVIKAMYTNTEFNITTLLVGNYRKLESGKDAHYPHTCF